LGPTAVPKTSASCQPTFFVGARFALHAAPSVKSGLAAARARGVKLGRQVGQRPSDKKAKKVLGLHADGLSYRLIARNVGMSKNTVIEIVRRSAGQ
jgi:DNA-binding NarL/FixJ family response regulator